MEQLTFLITDLDEPIKPIPEPEFKKGEGWFQVALFHYPTKKSLDRGKAEQVDTLIYAKTELAAKQKASRWAKTVQTDISSKYAIDGIWEKLGCDANRYGYYYLKGGNYYSCNPRLFLIPNNLHGIEVRTDA